MSASAQIASSVFAIVLQLAMASYTKHPRGDSRGLDTIVQGSARESGVQKKNEGNFASLGMESCPGIHQGGS